MTIFIIVIAWLVLGYIGARGAVRFMRPYDTDGYRLFCVVMGVVAAPLMFVVGCALAMTDDKHPLPMPAFLSAFLKRVLP